MNLALFCIFGVLCIAFCLTTKYRERLKFEAWREEQAAERAIRLAKIFPYNQSRELCLAAVRECGWALESVKEQTEELCLAAVRQEGLALMFVANQTFDICLAAVQQNPDASEFINDAKMRAQIELIIDSGVLNHGEENDYNHQF